MLIHTLFGFILYLFCHKHTHVCWRLPVFLCLIRYMQKFGIIYMPSNLVRMTYKGNYTYIAWHTLSFSHNLIFGLFYCRFWPLTTGVDILWIISGSNVFCLLLVRPLSMSSNTFVNGAHMSGVCAFIVVYFE